MTATTEIVQHLDLTPQSTPMTDEQALFKAQRIWGPTISLIRETSVGFWRKEACLAMLWTADRSSAEVVACSLSYASCKDAPASWEAMFASVQAVAK